MPRSRKNVVRRKLADGSVKTYVYEGGTRTDAEAPRPKTIGDLILYYRAAGDWRVLAPATKATYNAALKKLEDVRATFLDDIDYAYVERLQTHLSDTPGIANITTALLTRMFRRAVRAKWMTHNPAAELPKLKTGTGKPWPQWAIRQFRDRAPAEWVFILDLMLACGQRVGDVRALRWSDYDGAWIRLVQKKTGSPADVPLMPEMIGRLNARKRKAKGLTIITARHGRPYTKTGFETAWGKVMKAVGLDGKGFTRHGIRHTTGTMLADAGSSEHTIAGWLGHKSLQSTRRYTQNADRRRLAEEALPRFAAEWQNGKTNKSN